MGGITSGIGIFSGIDSATLIDQLISVQSRPLILAQSRVIQLNQQQAAYLDINSRMNTFKSAAASFRIDNIFQSSKATSSAEGVLTASASNNAVPGSYNFIVDRLVSSQQLLTRGFADRNTSAIGLDSLTFESPAARIDSNTNLADLNNGNGVTRGEITINGTEVDLSRAGTVQEVLDAINEVDGVDARVENDKFVIDGVTSLSQQTGAGILESFGLNTYSGTSTTITGTSVYELTGTTSLGALNDGRGVEIRDTSGSTVTDFNILINGETVGIRIGEIEGELTDDDGDPILDDDGNPEIGVIEGAVSTVNGVIDRINTALSDAGYGEVTASINTTTGGIDIVDSLGRDFDVQDLTVGSGAGARTYSTATDLGIAGSYTGGTANGERIFAGLNTKLVSSLNGGAGLAGTDGLLNITTRDGSTYSGIDVSGLNDINDIINTINTATGGDVTVSVNRQGTGLSVVDNTTGGGSFSISGSGGADTAAALGISGTFTDGTADGSNLQIGYVSNSTLLTELNNGQGIGTGEFEIVDSYGNRATINITNSTKTVGDLLDEINDSGLRINARINENGDGITIAESLFADDGGVNGTQTISITDTEGNVADKLGIEGTASDVDGENFISGSEERVIEFEPDATLEDIRNAIDAANVGVSASIVNTGAGASPFRLSLASERSGEAGRFLIDTGDFDLGLSVLDEGNDARVFFGSNNAASGVLLTSSVNSLDGVIQGVELNLLSASDDPVQITVSRDTGSIESKIEEFVAAFNSVIEGIDFRTRYDQETEERGVLLGDSTMLNLRNSLFGTLRRANQGFDGDFNTLTEVGIKVGSGGKLEFDSEKFRDAYADNPEAVEAIFTQRTLDDNDDGDPNTIDEPSFSELSVLGQLEEFAESYVTSIGGVLQNRRDALDSQIQLQEDRIESIQESLNRKRETLSRQFLAMEQAIGSFQSQGSALSQIASLG
jgi:flagellar capping protein FliD